MEGRIYWKKYSGTSLVIQRWRFHASTAGGSGSTPSLETKPSHASWHRNKKQKTTHIPIFLHKTENKPTIWTMWGYCPYSRRTESILIARDGEFIPQRTNPFIFFSSVQSLSRVRLFVTPWTAARQASLSITNSQSLPKLMSIESVMPSSHLILCRPLLLLPPIPPNIRVFPMSQLFAWGGQRTGVSVSASILPKNTQDWSPLEWTEWISLQSKGLSNVFSNTTVFLKSSQIIVSLSKNNIYK